MKVALFGASGMVGQGVLLECLERQSVSSVLVVGRSPCGIEHPKVEEILHGNFADYGPIEDRFGGLDACFFCLGVSAAGMSEEDYRHVTFDLTVSAAETLSRLNPEMVFCYVSGAGTDSSEKGRSMWARVKGMTENRLLKMPFKSAYMFRPGYIQPMKGVRSKTRLYQATYTVLAPLYPVWKTLFPGFVTTTEKVGLAMIRVAECGFSKSLLDNRDINDLASDSD
ncbi:MAG: hypothetical protein OQK55_01895 [Thermoanaerobaculales bacterium]|nr:hypothetical protein [Thermoanaerobaculales bacterium]